MPPWEAQSPADQFAQFPHRLTVGEQAGFGAKCGERLHQSRARSIGQQRDRCSPAPHQQKRRISRIEVCHHLLLHLGDNGGTLDPMTDRAELLIEEGKHRD